MKRIHILVEGQTEETFVTAQLAPHLLARALALMPVLLKTKRLKAGGHFKGGITSYAQVQGDLRRLLGDSSAVCVTTMLDFYGLPEDFPGASSKPAGTCYQRVEHVERAFAADLQHPRFLPYLALHEFEALLFTAPERCASVFSDAPEVIATLQKHRDSVATPEEINEGPRTAPSKRILEAYPAYQKTLHGPLAVLEIGLSPLRAACPHFDQWVSKLESLA
jgi:hypothetical protein